MHILYFYICPLITIYVIVLLYFVNGPPRAYINNYISTIIYSRCDGFGSISIEYLMNNIIFF